MIDKQIYNLDKYDDIIELIPDIVCLTDHNGIIVNCNERLLSQNGYEKNEIVGKSGYSFLTKKSQEKIYDLSSEIMTKGRMENIAVEAIKKDGTIYNALTTVSLIRDKNKKFQGTISIIKDVAEFYQIKKELDEQKEKNLSVIGTLSSKMAHDIRNPLSIISMTLENIKMNKVQNSEEEKQFNKIQRAIFRITHQIDDVLDFVKKQPLKLNKVKMSDLIADALDSIYTPNYITLNLPKNDVELNCDIKKLSVAFTNLILNAIQAVGDVGTVEITIEENKDEVIIKVKDSGKGIPKENLNKIFEPLFTTKMEGTGLGLASVMSIINSHGGIISVASPPTIFTITLPKIT